MKKAGLFYYENDYKSFEASFVRDLMIAGECQVYSYLLSKYPSDARYINSVLTGVNRLHTRVGVRINLEARRMSGDMCTSVGNGLTNLLIVSYLCQKKKCSLDAVVEGDDGIFAVSKQLTEHDFRELGFWVEIHEVSDPCKAHFCGMTFAESGEIIKNPRRVLQTFGWTHSYLNAGPKIMDSLLRSKALSLAYELPQCPIVGVLSRVTLELTRAVTLTHVEEMGL